MNSQLQAISAGPSAAECRAPSVGLDPCLDSERIASVAKALAEPLRVQVLDVLRRSEQDVCQCELIALLGITQPLLSHHMRKLVESGLVNVERRHRWAYYTVAPDAFSDLSGWLAPSGPTSVARAGTSTGAAESTLRAGTSTGAAEPSMCPPGGSGSPPPLTTPKRRSRRSCPR